MPFKVSDYAGKISERFDTLCLVADSVLADPMFKADVAAGELNLIDQNLLRTVEAYFLVNAAYKRLTGIKKTEPPKIAAMSAICFSEFRPFVVRDRHRITSVYSLFANQILSLHWAAVVFDQDLDHEIKHRLRSDGLLRYLRLAKGARLTALEPYKADMRLDPPNLGRSYDMHLGDTQNGDMFIRNMDLTVIESLILPFELMWNGNGRMVD